MEKLRRWKDENETEYMGERSFEKELEGIRQTRLDLWF